MAAQRNLLLSLALVMMFSSHARAGLQDFILSNETGVDIAEIHISKVAKEDWGKDVLSVDILPSGKECRITFSRKDNDEYWDMLIVDLEGTSLEWPGLNLASNSKITLTIENGTPIATYE